MNNSLRELHLSKHQMTDTGVKWIATCLKENISLTHLDLSWLVNYISNAFNYYHYLLVISFQEMVLHILPIISIQIHHLNFLI